MRGGLHYEMGPLTHPPEPTYPCCLPALGDSAGAGRIRLAAAKIRNPG